MALILETSVRTDIITRRRYTLDKRIANRLSAVLWANDGRTHQRDNSAGECVRSATKRVAGGFRTNRKGSNRIILGVPSAPRSMRWGGAVRSRLGRYCRNQSTSSGCVAKFYFFRSSSAACTLSWAAPRQWGCFNNSTSCGSLHRSASFPTASARPYGE